MEPSDNLSHEVTPLILLVDDEEWTSRSVENALRPKGHVVLRARTGQQATDLVSKVNPDALLVDFDLPDMDGTTLLRKLRNSSTIQATSPVLVLTKSAIGRAQRLDALAAGAWDCLTHPVDPSELILRLDTFVRVKRESDRVRDQGLTDTETGLYNVRGILLRVREISADAMRSRRPVTCLALGPPSKEDAAALGSDVRGVGETDGGPLASAIREVTRGSDTIGRLGSSEFVVVAPGTDQTGALRLADRLLEALDATRGEGPQGAERVRAGLCVLDSEEATSAEELLLRATLALRSAQADSGSFRVRAYPA